MNNLLDNIEHQNYYLRNIGELSDSHGIIATENIYNDHGLTLIENGASINRDLLAKALRHKLTKPLDACISIAGALTVEKLMECAYRLVRNTPGLQILLPEKASLSNLFGYIGRAPLNAQLINKLTVMRHCLPERFEHSLMVTFASLSIGGMCKVSENDLQKLAAIGLFHDIGILHINPALLEDPGRPLGPEDWRQIHLHPLLGFFILNGQSLIHSSICQAVLEHHERIDGSGYPRHTRGEKISQLGKIIAVAETVVGICQKNPIDHLITILKSNVNKLDNGIMDKLNAGLYENTSRKSLGNLQRTASGQSAGNIRETKSMAETITAVYYHWYKNADKSQSPEFSEFMQTRLEHIRHSLVMAGMSPIDGVTRISQFHPEALESLEIASMLREAIFHLKLIIIEIESRNYHNTETSGLASAWIGLTARRISIHENAGNYLTEVD